MITHLKRAIEIAGSQSALARACGCTQNAIWAALNRGRISADLAIRIEQALDGQVTVEQLRPDLYRAPQPVTRSHRVYGG